ncbi:MAG: hypothetical protein HFJ74_03545 [Eggerthellaceae bacterium]|nr:hypothetical protein [Eggerthellaceae bacterium]
MRWPWRRGRDGAVPTMFGPARVYDTEGPDGAAIRVLEVGGAFQSAAYVDGRPEAPFAYLRAFDAIFDAGVPMRRVLMLGGGAFAYPRHVLARRGDVELDVVEADPAIVALARERFFLADAERAHAGRLRVIVADALVYLADAAAPLGAIGCDPLTPDAATPLGCSDVAPALRSSARLADAAAPLGAIGCDPLAPYDAILNDVFQGVDPDAGLLAPEGLALVRASLAPGGLYLVNVVVPGSPEGVAALIAAGRALERAFDHVSVIPCADEGFSAQDNYLLVATDGLARVPGALPLPPV